MSSIACAASTAIQRILRLGKGQSQADAAHQTTWRQHCVAFLAQTIDKGIAAMCTLVSNEDVQTASLSQSQPEATLLQRPTALAMLTAAFAVVGGIRMVHEGGQVQMQTAVKGVCVCVCLLGRQFGHSMHVCLSAPVCAVATTMPCAFEFFF